MPTIRFYYRPGGRKKIRLRKPSIVQPAPEQRERAPTNPRPAPLLVCEREACRLLHISRSTLYRLRKAGVITPVSLMGAVRYRVAEIEQIAAPEACA